MIAHGNGERGVTMKKRAELLDSSIQSRLAEQERRLREAEDRKRLNLEARRICVELNEKKRAARGIVCEPGGLADESRLKEEVRHRFKIANPVSSENDFEAYWMTILDDLSRERAKHLLAEKMKELHAQTQC
ncbi:MAG TPA: hypothetical protein VNI02_12020 [Blastocatellia bacterium]|nr:hypothetical protein [Blastocatellia bacterium]